MKSQHTISFKWITIPLVLAVFVNSALFLPSVSAQDEFPPTPTQTPTEEPTEEPVVDDLPESTPQPSDIPPSEGPSIQSFSHIQAE